MARGGAGIQSGSVYHLISRFVAKEWFIESAVERRAYLALLGTAIAATDWRLFSYALMSSHIHLGVLAGTMRLREWMRPMHATFANWMNERRQRIGAVFVRGPNVVSVSDDHVARMVRYIHLNPVRAAVVAEPGESDWTSHRAYEGTAFTPSWLDTMGATHLAGFTSPREVAAWCRSTQHCDDDDSALLSPKLVRGRPTKICELSELTAADRCAEKAKPARAVGGFLS